MLYQSKYADLQVFIRSQSIQYHPATGVEIGRVPRLTANFGMHGGEYMVEDPLTGQPERHAQIYGHFFDTEEAKERLGWTDEEHESVVYTLDRLCKSQPFLIAKVEHEATQLPLAPSKPWPNYDEMHWRSIASTAESIGMVEGAIVYEKENRKREAVIEALEAKLNPVEQAEEVEISV